MHCCVCLDEKDEFVTLRCSHKICDECFPELEKVTNKCPYCRCLFEEENHVEIEGGTVSQRNTYFIDPLLYNQTIRNQEMSEEINTQRVDLQRMQEYFYLSVSQSRQEEFYTSGRNEQVISRFFRDPREHVELNQRNDVYTIERELKRKELYRLQRQKEIYKDEQRREELYNAQRERHLKRNEFYRIQKERELKERETQKLTLFEFLKSKNLIFENAIYELFDDDYIMKIYEEYIEECSKIKTEKCKNISKDVRRNRKILRQERYNETIEREQMFLEDNLSEKDNFKEIEEKIRTIRENKLMIENDLDVTKLLIEKEISKLNKKAKEDKVKVAKVVKVIKEEKPKKGKKKQFFEEYEEKKETRVDKLKLQKEELKLSRKQERNSKHL